MSQKMWDSIRFKQNAMTEIGCAEIDLYFTYILQAPATNENETIQQ